MKRFATLLTLFGCGFLLAALVLLFLPFNPNSLQSILTSDGAFDPLALYAFSALKSGLLIAGVIILLISLLFHLTDRGIINLFGWSTRKFLLIIIGVQFVLSLIYISQIDYTPSGDSEWYHRQAINLANGLGLINHIGAPTAFWPVGYPFLLSILYRIFGVHVFIAQVLNILLFCGISLLVYLLGRDIFDVKVARCATLITALIPSQIFYTLNPLADIPCSFLVILLMYLSTKKSSLINTLLIGLLLGLSNLIRANMLFFIVILAGFRFSRDRSIKPILTQSILILVICEAVLLPWQIRNYRIFNTFVMVSNNAGYNLAMGNNPRASGGVMTPDAFNPPDSMGYFLSLNESQQDRYLSQLGKNYILSHPGHTLILAMRKLIHLYYKDSKGITYGLSESFNQLPAAVVMCMILITEGYYYSLGLTFLIALMFWLKKEGLTDRVWLIAGTIAYFTVVFLPFIAEGRFHMPLLPLFALVIGSMGLAASKADLY